MILELYQDDIYQTLSEIGDIFFKIKNLQSYCSPGNLGMRDENDNAFLDHCFVSLFTRPF